MNNNYNCNLTIEGDLVYLDEIAKVCRDNDFRLGDNSDIQFDSLAFDGPDLILHYESSNEHIDEIKSFSKRYPSLTFTIEYDSYPDNISGTGVIVNDQITSHEKIPREITLKISLWELADCDRNNIPEINYDVLPFAIAYALNKVLMEYVRDTEMQSVLHLIQEIHVEEL